MSFRLLNLVLLLLNFLFNCLYQNVDASLEFDLGPRHKQVVKSNARISPDRMLNLSPVPVAVLMRQTQQHDLSLLAKVLRLLKRVDHQFLQRSLDSRHLRLDQQGSRLLEIMNTGAALKDLLQLCSLI